MDSISTARDFFINQQGLSPDQADMIVSKGMEAYNQQSQPQQNMMQMASGGIARLGYQMGGSPMGVGTMPMDYGQSLQVPQQMPTNFSSAQSITSNPLLNYGQPQLGTAGGTPLSMNRGGIARLGYQMGGEAMMQPQGMQQEQGMGQLGEGDNALLTIIQLLIEQGVDPEIAEKLARQILQIFAQGGEPALDQFINQLEQQEMSQDRTMMAGGGLTSIDRARDMLQSRAPNGEFLAYINPQEAGILRSMGGAGQDVNVRGVPSFFLKSIGKAISGAVKGVAKAVKSVAKSDIGRIALTIGAGMLLGPAGGFFGGAGLGASLTTNAFLAGAINAGAANLLVQGITTGKINPKEALLAGALGGVTGYMSPTSVGIDPTTGQAITTTGTNITTDLVNKGIGPLPSAENAILDTTGFGTDYGPTAGLRTAPSVNDITGARSDIFTLDKATLDPAAGKGSQIYNPPTNVEAKPGFFQDTLNKAQTGIQNLYKDPIGTIKGLGTAALDYTQKEPGTALALAAGAGSLATLGAQLGVPRNEGEDDDSYAKRLEGVQGYLTQYGRNLSIKDPYFYQREGAVNPFAPTMAANGGIMGYKKGGSMVPPARQIEGGIIELDARKTGGYIPYGKKERVDDVPAMLAKDEFVFTSRAVKAAGGGSAKRGAKKMYALMKQLESKGARA
jgi:hypothetical protein